MFARALDDSGRPAAIAAAAGVLLLAGWLSWFLFARVSVYDTSLAARLEVDAASYRVDAPVSGRVVRSLLVLGQEVKAGDVLIELEAETFRRERDAETTRLGTLAPQLAALRRELEEAGQALLGEWKVAAASLGEARARQRASGALA